MRGKVVWIDPTNSELSKVQIDGSYLVLIELLGHEVEIGDEIKGDLENLGGETLYNVTQQEYIDVFIQDLY